MNPASAVAADKDPNLLTGIDVSTHAAFVVLDRRRGKVDINEPIDVASADAFWPEWFEAEAARLRDALPPWVFPGIEHIGSTAVPDLDAKPIIDIMLGIARPTSLGDWLPVLERLGYESLGIAGVPGRWALRRRGGERAFNISVIAFEGNRWRENLATRQYLRASSAARDQYARAKHKAISQGANTLFAYSDAKRPAVEGIIAEALSQSQLEMTYPVDRFRPPSVVSALHGYALRPYREGDGPAWYLLMERAGFGLWNDERLRQWIARIPPESWFMALDGQSGAIVASAMGLHDHSDRHPSGAKLGWVAVDPNDRRKGLGAAVCASVTARLIDAGYREIHLYTEDFRLAALALYLKLGYQPFIYAPDMLDRWRHVCEAVGWMFTPDQWRSVETETKT